MADNFGNQAKEKDVKKRVIVIILALLLLLLAVEAYFFIIHKSGEAPTAVTEQPPQNVAVAEVDTMVAEEPMDVTTEEASPEMEETAPVEEVPVVEAPRKDLTAAEIESIVMKGQENLVAVLNFKFDEDTTSLAELEALSNDVQQKLEGKTKMVIAGHADAMGSENYNQQLSERRAAFVAGTMRGLANLSFGVIGYGETKPVADNETEEGRSKNRRVEIYVE